MLLKHENKSTFAVLKPERYIKNSVDFCNFTQPFSPKKF